MSGDGKGYPLPETIDPGSVVCVRVYIPDDPIYLSAFWAAYQYFTQWSAWERTTGTEGRDAALVWLNAYKLARSDWVAERGCDYAPQQQYETGDGSEELADYLYAIKVIIDTVVDMLNDGKEYTFFEAWYLDTFGVWPGNSWLDTWQYLDELTPAERDEQLALVPYEDLYNTTWCTAEEVCSEGSYQNQFLCWVQNVSAGIVGILQDASAEFLNKVGDALGITNDALGNGAIEPYTSRYHGYGEYFDFDDIVCWEWEHTIDFTTGDGGFVVGASGYGSWVSGQGWLAGYVYGDTYGWIKRSISSNTIFASMVVQFASSGAGQVACDCSGYGSGRILYVASVSAGENTYSDYGDESTSEYHLTWARSSVNESDYLRSITLRGTGDNPFL